MGSVRRRDAGDTARPAVSAARRRGASPGAGDRRGPAAGSRPVSGQPAGDAGADHALTVRQAAFIGVGAMVGAGIFALLGAAVAVGAAAVWLPSSSPARSPGLHGYSFAKFGARYPSAAGLLEYLRRGFGEGHLIGVTAWLIYVPMGRPDRSAGVRRAPGAAALSLVLAGSAVALLVFGMCTVAHFRVRSETGARLSLLILAVTTAGIALVAFLLDRIVNDPGVAPAASEQGDGNPSPSEHEVG